MITLPNEIVVLLAAGIGFLVTNGLKSLFPTWDISGSAAQITAAFVTVVVALANQGLALVPVQYQQVVLTVFTLIITVLGAFGIHYSFKSRAK
jgi:ABC-type Na+ efflux pump permease subunit